MKIKANQLFKHGRDTYQNGEVYDVPILDAVLMVKNGFAEVVESGVESKDSGVTHPGEVTLEVQDALLGVKDEILGS